MSEWTENSGWLESIGNFEVHRRNVLVSVWTKIHFHDLLHNRRTSGCTNAFVLLSTSTILMPILPQKGNSTKQQVVCHKNKDPQASTEVRKWTHTDYQHKFHEVCLFLQCHKSLSHHMTQCVHNINIQMTKAGSLWWTNKLLSCFFFSKNQPCTWYSMFSHFLHFLHKWWDEMWKYNVAQSPVNFHSMISSFPFHFQLLLAGFQIL